jgi:hypothetical protein
MGPNKLAEKVLSEVPEQFVNYMLGNKIKPTPLAFP